MKLEFIKQAGGVLAPADDYTAEKMTKFKTGEQYPIEIKRARNPSHHKKAMAFLRFCFEHWAGGHRFTEESLQFDQFRRELTILAGFYDEFYTIDSSVRLEEDTAI